MRRATSAFSIKFLVGGFFVGGLLTTSVCRGASFDCHDIYNAQLKLSTHASNVINASTTRTTTGGCYKKKQVICKGSDCFVKMVNDKKVMYEPGHPDADRRGYVNYPNIDLNEEISATSMAVRELSLLAKSGACGTNVLESLDSTLIKYRKGTVKTDQFNFSKDGRVIAWIRQPSRGKTQFVKLNP